MHFQVCSDLHLEFHRDDGRCFIESMNNNPEDALIIAGDLCTLAMLDQSLDALCSKFRAVFYVHGNHEHYGTPKAVLEAATIAATKRNTNLHWLRPGYGVSIDGTRVLGATLWFKHDATAPKHAMNDFYVIPSFEDWVYEENRDAVNFFSTELRKGDVAVSHHLPTYASISPKYVGNPLNSFFLCDLTPLLLARQPALWIHGHTHESCDTRVGAARVVCNPFGYLRQEENRQFDPSFIVETC